MHRIVSARNVYQSSFHSFYLSPNCTFKKPNLEIKCSFCRKILLGRHDADNLIHSRHQSTKAANAVKSHKKKTKYKNYKKYGELLQVGEQAMTETKIQISKLKASQLSKLASSSVSLGQLHQLSTKPNISPTLKEVDPELLQSIKEKILKKCTSAGSKEIVLEDDQCALVYTNQSISSLENQLKTKLYIDVVKESYFNFRKATLYDQRLQDLRYAISEGLTQEFELESTSTKVGLNEGSERLPPKRPHAIFKELFVDHHLDLDSYDQELMTHISNLQTRGIAHPAIEDLYDSGIHGDIAESAEDIDIIGPSPQISLNIKKAKQEINKKRKERRAKRRALQELSMKEELSDISLRGKRDALHRMLAAHLQLLCALNMTHEGRQVLHYYRQRGSKMPERLTVSDVRVYNTLLHGYAALGQLENTKELLSCMREDKVKMNAQTFAAVFECIERSQMSEKHALINLYHREMQDKNITLNDLLDKTKFHFDQREVVLKAIRRIDSDFVPQYTPPVLDYECPLLDKLKLDQVENRRGLLSSPSEGVLTLEEMKEKAKRQLEIEIKGDIVVQNIDVKDESSSNVKFYRQKLRETEEEWRTVIKQAFVRNLGTLRSQSKASHSAITLYPYLKVLEVDQFVDLIMGEISKLVDGSETYSPTLTLLQRDLGTQVYHKYQIEQYRRNGVLAKIERVYAQYCEWYTRRSALGAGAAPLNARQAWQTILHRDREGASLDGEEAAWPMETRQNIGKFLYNIIINDVKIDVNMFKSKAKVKKLPGVYKVHRYWARAARLELKPHPALARLWAAAARPALRMRAPLLPAAAPPRPWADLSAGAYLVTSTPLIRVPYNVVNQWKRLKEAPPASLYPVLDSLNQLGEVPWVINRPILDLQLQIFRAGGNKKLDIPPPASALDLSQFAARPGTGTGTGTGAGAGAGTGVGTGGSTGTDMDTGTKVGAAEDAASAFKRRLAVNRARAEMHSLWCDALYKLSLANHYRESVFWLPHNLDFRGRVYACPPHLSQLGADPARALLQFANKQPLGPHGLTWLKLHCVNLTGTMKKATIDERLVYADSILDKILDSADKPLDGEGWWQLSEEPWQTLACCIEIANAVRSPNHEEYVSGFPVHQDGSCNGLQHYAALGGDAPGAAAVNLAPAARPADVYSAVAALIEEMRCRDAAAGVPAAVALEGFVRRKVIKQTVMTTVYGVTRFGARLQIAKQLKDIDEFPKEQVWACSQYLTQRTFDSLREMFTSTKLIQDWFTDCAKVISGVCGESVEWVTPLGLPVVQPYHRRAPLHSAPHSAPVDHHQRPCTMKQRNAFPPNFIHSLDSSHMMLTSLHAQAAPLCFVSVHDCYWTHPRSVSTMNKICREQFVALHSQPILEDLSNFLVKRYSYEDSELEDASAGAANKRRVNSLLRKVPAKGDFELRKVLDSVYFFS